MQLLTYLKLGQDMVCFSYYSEYYFHVLIYTYALAHLFVGLPVSNLFEVMYIIPVLISLKTC